MIKIDSITKTFDTVRSLTDVSIIIEKGSIFGLIGSNGSGKSTLLRIMSGVYKPDSGDILYDGMSVWENSGVKQNIVYLSDNQYFLPNSTAQDMMMLYKSIYPTFSVEKYKTYLKVFDLDEKRKLSTVRNTFSVTKRSTGWIRLCVRPSAGSLLLKWRIAGCALFSHRIT